MAHITFDYSKVLDKFVAPHEVDNLQAQVTVADEMIRKGTGPGADFLGWRDLPENYDREEFDRILKAAEKIKEDLQAANIRASVDKRNEKIGYKIRQAQLKKIPYMLVVGEKEVSSNTVSVRSRKNGDLGSMSLAEFISTLKEEIENKK